MKRIMIILSCPAIVGCSRLSHREVIRMQGIPGFTLLRMPGHIMLFVGVVDDTILPFMCCNAISRWMGN